jgi:alkyl hydroperoxide reductase subunit AhpC
LFLSSSLLNAQLAIGSKAPVIRLSDVSGNIIALDSLKGQWVLVDFWASWCAPCRLSNRDIRKYYQDWKTKGLEVLGVSLDENRDNWIKAIKKDKISWLQVNSPPKWDDPLVLNWRFERIPTSYLIDPAGIVQAVNPDPKSVSKFISNQ